MASRAAARRVWPHDHTSMTAPMAAESSSENQAPVGTLYSVAVQYTLSTVPKHARKRTKARMCSFQTVRMTRLRTG